MCLNEANITSLSQFLSNMSPYSDFGCKMGSINGSENEVANSS